METFSSPAVTGRPQPRTVARAQGAARVIASDFETVYRNERDRLVRALSIAIGDDALATEAVDEAFTRALHRWHAVGTFDEPAAWIYRTARNWATSRFRRRRRDRTFAPDIARPESVEPSTQDPELAAALRQLPDDQRNVLVLRYYLDWTIGATADALDISPGTVKSRTSRALNELNRILGEN